MNLNPATTIRSVKIPSSKKVIPFHIDVSNEQRFITFFESLHSSSHSIFKSSKNLNGSHFLVPSTTLDFIWRTHLDHTVIHLIKIDVEGAELLVVKGMKEMLSENKVKEIILEFHPKIIVNAGGDPYTLFPILSDYFSVYYIPDKVENNVHVRTQIEFDQFINQNLELDKTEGRHITLFYKRK